MALGKVFGKFIVSKGGGGFWVRNLTQLEIGLVPNVSHFFIVFVSFIGCLATYTAKLRVVLVCALQKIVAERIVCGKYCTKTTWAIFSDGALFFCLRKINSGYTIVKNGKFGAKNTKILYS